jgi:S-formylglutathione hydrolase FrmB
MNDGIAEQINGLGRRKASALWKSRCWLVVRWQHHTQPSAGLCISVFLWLTCLLLTVNGCASRRDSSEKAPVIAVEYRRLDTPRAWEYAIYRIGRETRSGNVLYFLHGHGDDVFALRDGYRDLLLAFERRGVSVTIVAVSFGVSWFLVPANTSPKSGLYSVFVESVMPTVERSLGVTVNRRSVVGVSMGGFNAFQLASRNPELFDGVALVSPAVLGESPYSSKEKIDAYFERTERASSGFFGRARHWLTGTENAKARISEIFRTQGEALPDEKSWNEAWPLLRSKEFSSRKKFRFYLSCGRADEFGLFESAETIARNLRSKAVEMTWVPLKGNHSAFDPESIAGFFAQNFR